MIRKLMDKWKKGGSTDALISKKMNGGMGERSLQTNKLH